MLELVIWQEKKSGVSSRILKFNDKTLYVHCFNHRFNRSPKREQFLKNVKKLFDVDTTKEKLIHVCLTH